MTEKCSLRGLRALLVALTFLAGSSARAAEPKIDFNRQIRPILSNACYRCHGPDAAARKGGLRLDERDKAIAKRRKDPAIEPGHPDKSAMMARIASIDPELRMPPPGAGKQISPQEQALLKQWIEQGATYAEHWAWLPPQRPTPPAKLSNPSWAKNDVDRFILERLDRDGLKPNAEADRFTIIRRVSLALTGLPPTLEEVERFVNDKDPNAYEKLVDRLLASPAYGERWARVWLDLARYADSAGYADDPPRVIWRYRDWVIKAINDNMPFDKFTIEQLAGDMLSNPTESQLIATAFHRNTMTNNEGGTNDEEFRNAAIVDRVNTTFEVWMGLTMQCAQCHTHKYDPITQEEYFRVFAILNQSADSDKGDESPTLADFTPEMLAKKKELEAKIEELTKKIAATPPPAQPNVPLPKGQLKARFVRVQQPGTGVYLHLAEVQAFAGEANLARNGKATQISTDYNGPPELANDGNTNGDYNAKSTSHTAQANNPWWEVDLLQPAALDKIVVWNRTDGGTAARLQNFRVILLDEKRQPLWVGKIAASPNPNVALKPPATGEALTAADKTALAEYAGVAIPMSEDKKQLDAAKKELAGIKGITTPIMRELAANQRRKTHIQMRGNFLDLGKEVTPGVPAMFPPLPEGAEANRLALAKWLVDARNPLTARVTANRYWEKIFGLGLVETSEDFGVQGEPPAHPELLDYLATELVRNGWDTKKLVKEIVTSATYRQQSTVTPEKLEKDARNRLLSRGPRYRLEAETIRDQALAVSGLLSKKMHGAPVRPPQPKLGLSAAFGGSTDWETSPGEDKYRRGLYTSWRRSQPYPSMATFDAPTREVCTTRRINTNTPLQAMVTLNDPVYVEAAQALARRLLTEGGATTRERAQYGFRLCVARPATAKELDRIVALYDEALARYTQAPAEAKKLAEKPLGPLPEKMDAAEAAAWTVVGNVLLNLDEFLAQR